MSGTGEVIDVSAFAFCVDRGPAHRELRDHAAASGAKASASAQ
jgi:hypothetical protein